MTSMAVSDNITLRQQLVLKKKKDFDYLTTSILKEQQMHMLASVYFKAVYNWGFFLPSIAITLVSGILAAVVASASNLDLSEHKQTLINIVIAALAALSIFWQSLTKQLDYGGRALLHDSAAVALKRLYDDSTLTNREMRYDNVLRKLNGIDSSGSTPVLPPAMRSMSSSIAPPPTLPNISPETNDGGINMKTTSEEEEKESEDDEDRVKSPEKDDPSSSKAIPAPVVNKEKTDGEKDHKTISEQFAQAVDGCNSVLPVQITAAFNALETRVAVCNKSLKRTLACGDGDCVKIKWEQVYPALYHQLALTIINSRSWPACIPKSAWCVEKTLADFKEILKGNNESDLLEVLVKRAETIEEDTTMRDTKEPFVGV